MTAHLPDESPIDISDMADALETIRLGKLEIEKWKDVVEAAKDKIKGRMGHHETGTVNGETIVTWKWNDVTRLDHTAIRATVDPETLKHFEYTNSERRFVVKE